MGKTTEYNLYLDESGNFDEDLKNRYSNECIVGGFLVKKDEQIDLHELENKFVDVWNNLNKETKERIIDNAFENGHIESKDVISKKNILNMLHHATELDYTLKAEPVYELVRMASTVGTFVIFENYKKTKVVDSSTTYINILAEGIIQLLTAMELKDKDPDDKIKLNIVAGYRRDMTLDEKKWIEKEEIEKRVKERLSLMKIRNESLKASWELKLDNDKGNTYLVVCDYICHFYFKRNADIYDSYREELLNLYSEDSEGFNCNLKSNAEHERILQGYSSDNYSSLLFDAATGIIEDEKNIESILEKFCTLTEKTRKIHLSNLINYFNKIIGIERELNNGEKILKFGARLLEKLDSKKMHDYCFQMDLILYEITLANHRGNLQKVSDLYEKAQLLLPQIMAYSENIDYVFIFLNRYAVYLLDKFEFEKAFYLTRDVIEKFEAFELLSSELISLKELQCVADSDMKWKSDQKGRILGTQTLIAIQLYRMNLLTYDYLVDINQNAIDNLYAARDKQRQYQYKADIEGLAGNIKNAYEALLKGLNVNTLNKIEYNDPFALYHVSIFYKNAVYNFSEEIKEEAEKAKAFLKRPEIESIYCEKEHGYPYFICAANVADAYAKKQKPDIALVKKYYKAAIMDDPNDEMLIRYLRLMIRCSYVYFLQNVSDTDAEVQIKEVEERCSAFLQMEGLPEKMREMLQELMDTKDYHHFAEQRHY